MNLSIASLWDAFSLQGLVSESVMLSIDLSQSTSSSLRSVESTAQSPLQRFDGFIQALESNKIDTSGLQRLFFEVAELQSQKQALQHHLEALKTMAPNAKRAERIEEASKQLEALVSMQTIFTNACFKSGQSGIRGYWQRLWSKESWSEWSSARTDLGKLVLLASDYAYDTFSSESLPYKLRERGIDLDKASIEAQRVLVRFKEDEANDNLSTSFLNASRKLQEASEIHTFLKAYGGSQIDLGFATIATEDGGYVSVGCSLSYSLSNDEENAEYDNFLVYKIDGTGGIQWGTIIGGSSLDRAYSAQKTSDGGFIMVGQTMSGPASGDDNVLIVKLNATGSLDWLKEMGGYDHGYIYAPDIAHWVDACADGGFVYTGYTKSFGSNVGNALIVRIDAQGQAIWGKEMGGASQTDQGTHIEELSNGDLIMVGCTQSYGAGTGDILVTRTDEYGDVIWSRAVGGTAYEIGYSIKPTLDDAFILTGSTASFGSSAADAIIVKLNATGSLIWAKTMGGPGYDLGRAVHVTENNDFIVVARTSSYGAGQADVLLTKLDEDGALIWAKTLGGGSDDIAYTIEETTEGGFVLGGWTSSYGNQNPGFINYLTIRVDDSGNIDGCLDIQSVDPNITDITANISQVDAFANSTDIPNFVDITALSPSFADYFSSRDMTQELVEVPECSATEILPLQETTLPPVTTLDEQITQDGSQAVPNANFSTNHSTTFLETLSVNGTSQYGQPTFTHAELMSNGGMVLMGCYNPNWPDGDRLAFLAKTDTDGAQYWSQSIQFDVPCGQGNAIAKVANDSVILTGFSDDSYDPILMKFDSDGNVLWSKVLHGADLSRYSYIEGTSDGGFILAGSIGYSQGAGALDVLIAKMSSDGVLDWAKTFGGIRQDDGMTVRETHNGDYIIGGCSVSYTDNTAAIVFRVNTLGNIIWSRVLEQTQGCVWDIEEFASGDLVLIGQGFSQKDIGGSLVVRLNDLGELIWAKTLFVGYLFDAVVLENEEVVIASYTNYIRNTNDAVLLKLNANGAYDWVRWFEQPVVPGISFSGNLQTIEIANDGNLIVAGYGYGGGLIAKTNTSGWINSCNQVKNFSTSDASYSAALDNIDVTTNISGFPIVLSTDNVTASMQMLPLALNATNLTSSTIQSSTCPDITTMPMKTTPGIFEKTTVFPVPNTADTTQSVVTQMITSAVSEGAIKTFFKILGGSYDDYAYHLKMTDDSSMLLTAYTESFGAGNGDVLLAKIGTNGDLEWALAVGGSGQDDGLCVERALDGNWVLSGFTNSFGLQSMDVLLAKFDGFGDFKWVRAIGGIGTEQGIAIEVMSDGAIALTGLTTSFNIGSFAVLVAKLDIDGVLQWAQAFGGSSNDRGHIIKETASGDLVLVGYTYSFGEGSSDVLVAKWSNEGNLKWIKTLGGQSFDEGYGLVVMEDGGMLLAGYTASYATGYDDALLLKLSEDGDLLWALTIGGFGADVGFCIQKAKGNGFVLGGWTSSFGASGNDALFAKFDTNGNIKWARAFGGLGDEVLYTAVQDVTDDGWVLVGSSTSFGEGNKSMLLVKLDANGWVENCSMMRTVDPIITNITSNLTVMDISPQVLNITDLLKVSNVTPAIEDITDLLKKDTVCGVFDKESSSLTTSLADTATTMPIAASTAIGGMTSDNQALEYSMLTFVDLFGDEGTTAIGAMTFSGTRNVVLGGYTNAYSNSGFDLLLMSYDEKNPGLNWAYTLGGMKDEYVYDIQKTPDDGLVITGGSSSFSTSEDAYLLKLDKDGRLLWAQAFIGSSIDESKDILINLSGESILVGYTDSYGLGAISGLMLKVGSDGALLWAKTLSGLNDDWLLSIDGTKNGGFVVAGYSYSFGASGTDAITIGFDENATILWGFRTGGIANDVWHAIQAFGDGSIVLVGSTASFGPWSESLLVAKLDGNGELLWAKTVIGVGTGYAKDVQVLDDGGFILVGIIEGYDSIGGDSVLFVKWGQDGNLAWSRVLNHSGNEKGISILMDLDKGGFYSSGLSQLYGSNVTRGLLVKLNRSGWIKNCNAIQAIYPNVTDVTSFLWHVAISPTIFNITDSVFNPIEFNQTNVTEYFQNDTKKMCPEESLITTSGLITEKPKTTMGSVAQMTTSAAANSENAFEAYIKIIGGVGDDVAQSVQVTFDGGIVIAGCTTSFSDSKDILLAKLNATGYLVWAKTLGGTGADYSYFIAEDTDGHLMLAGYTESYGAGSEDALLVKLDGTGAIVWSKVFGGTENDGFYTRVETSDGGWVMTGWTDSFGAGSTDIWVIRLDSEGSLQWAQTFGGTSVEFGYFIKECQDGGWVLTGKTNSYGAGGFDLFVIKLDVNGDVVWSKTLGGLQDEVGYSIAESSDGGFVLTGGVESFGNANGDVCILKLSSTGQIVWAKAIEGREKSFGSSMVESSDGGWVLIGCGGYFDRGSLMIKLDAQGGFVWAVSLMQSFIGVSITETTDKGWLITGDVTGFDSGASDVFIAKLDATARMPDCHGTEPIAPNVTDISSLLILSDVSFVRTDIKNSLVVSTVSVDLYDIIASVIVKGECVKTNETTLPSVTTPTDITTLFPDVDLTTKAAFQSTLQKEETTEWSEITTVSRSFSVSDRPTMVQSLSTDHGTTAQYTTLASPTTDLSSTSAFNQAASTSMATSAQAATTLGGSVTTPSSLASTEASLLPTSQVLEQTTVGYISTSEQILASLPEVTTVRDVRTTGTFDASTMDGTTLSPTQRKVTHVLTTLKTRETTLGTSIVTQPSATSKTSTTSTIGSLVPTTEPNPLQLLTTMVGLDTTLSGNDEGINFEQMPYILAIIVPSVVGALGITFGVAYCYIRKYKAQHNNYTIEPQRRESRSPFVARTEASNEKTDGSIELEDASVEHPSLYQAAKQGQDALSAFLAEEQTDLESRTPRGRTALITAAKEGHLAAVESLLACKADLYSQDEAQLTPLHWAAREGHDQVMRVFLALEPNIEVVDKQRYTPLHWAAEKGQLAVVTQLLDRVASYDAKTIAKRTPLHLAAEEGYDQIVQLLLERKAEVNASDRYKYMPLHLAARGGHAAVVDVLLAWKAEVDAVLREGSTALHLAASGKHADAVNSLRRRGANLLATNKEEQMPFELAEGNHEVLGALAGPRLLNVWKSKFTPPGMDDVYTPSGMKARGCCPGYLVTAPNGQEYIAKFAFPEKDTDASAYHLLQSRTKRTKMTYLSHWMGVREKIAADTFAVLLSPYGYVAKHRLAKMQIANEYARDIRAIEDYMSDINRGRTEAIHEKSGLFLLSKMVVGYQDLNRLDKCCQFRGDTDKRPFRAFLEDGLLPAFAEIEDAVLPIAGLAETLAVARLLGDTDVLGGGGDNAGFVIEKNQRGEPIAVRVVKIDAGEAFSFDAPHNQLYQAVNNFSEEHKYYRENRLEDLRDMQFGNNHPVNIIWTKMQQKMQVAFLSVLKRGAAMLKQDRVMRVLVERFGVFDRILDGSKKLVTEKILQGLLTPWRANVALQEDLYKADLRMQSGELDVHKVVIPFNPRPFKVANFTEKDLEELLEEDAIGDRVSQLV